jgi:hypothetical protein
MGIFIIAVGMAVIYLGIGFVIKAVIILSMSLYVLAKVCYFLGKD